MKVQRTAKRYGDSGNGKQAGLRLLLLAVATIAARALPPQTSRRRMTKKRGTGRNNWLAALRRVTIRSSIGCFISAY